MLVKGHRTNAKFSYFEPIMYILYWSNSFFFPFLSFSPSRSPSLPLPSLPPFLSLSLPRSTNLLTLPRKKNSWNKKQVNNFSQRKKETKQNKTKHTISKKTKPLYHIIATSLQGGAANTRPHGSCPVVSVWRIDSDIFTP